MTIGVGGSTAEAELAAMRPMRGGAPAIDNAERTRRVERALRLMHEQRIDALYLDASTSLRYFTGLKMHASERLHGAVLTGSGELTYLCPAFEAEKLLATPAEQRMDAKLAVWEEHEDPTALVVDTVRAAGCQAGRIAVDEQTPFFTFDGLRRSGNAYEYVNAADISGACRMHKSDAELALMRTAKQITLEVQRATARMLHEGITTTEVQTFIRDAHARLGMEGPTTFCIVLFGEPTAYPHGVPYAQTLREGDMVLIDTGAPIDGYHSDITRSYVFGEPNARQREIWNLEQAAQAAAFEAAQPGVPCEAVDAAARAVIEAGGFGPGYAVPGLPHRTGHGIGLDVHEWTYLVKGNKTPLAPGMCFSNEPMICLYGEFGVRLEDHFHVTESGPRWFTEPCHSVDDPFASAAQ